MKATPAIAQDEFIGLQVKVVKSPNPSCIGLTGLVVDETRNTLIVRNKNSNKRIIKRAAVFQFTMTDGTIVQIDGNTILGRPEDRVKNRLRRLW